ncbi:MAG: MBL fold metallo-hydrolase [Candidatus Krumholzibacteriia bacterium]
MRLRRFAVGDVQVTLLDDGCFRLDGGGVFGIVPRPLWEQHMPPDGRNRVVLGLVCPLLESRGRRVLVDTGAGRKAPARLQEILALDPRRTLLDALREAGVEPHTIDVVTNTHLHYDHCGWNTQRDPDGNLLPTFPEATYVVQEAEWDAAMHPDERSAPAYARENFAPLPDVAKTFERICGEVELAAGVFTHPSPGHTCAHQCVRIESHGQTAIFLGDLVPTPAHIPVPWHMAYDLHPLRLMRTKRELLERAAREDWLLIFDHDPGLRVGRVERRDDWRLAFRPA